MKQPNKPGLWRLLAVTSAVAMAMSAYAADTKDEEQKEERIEVTGSRIKRSQLEGASPITVITFDDMKKEGHTNVQDALRSLSQATGSVQNEQSTNQFTVNAQTINLRGLGPGYTLVLLNGRRVADYPLPYNGQSNFTNLASIPTGIVERIEILSGGASSIYGSDAIAGVVNIITKKDMEGLTVDVRLGQLEVGAGDTTRLQVSGGTSIGEANLSFAYEYFKADAVYGKDISSTDSLQDRPDLTQPADLSRALLILSRSEGAYVNIDRATCDKFSDLTFSTRSQGGFAGGTYCGRDDVGDETLRGERDYHTLYGALTLPVGNGSEITANVNAWKSESAHEGFRLWWGSNDPFFDLDNGFDARYMQRFFSPEETGDMASFFEEQAVTANVGFSTTLGAYDFTLDFSTAKNEASSSETRFKAEAIDAYFLGDDLCKDGDYYQYLCEYYGLQSYGFYRPNYDNFLNPLTRAQAAALTGQTRTDADSSASTVSASLSGDLFELPAGAVSFALVAEFSTQDYKITLDDRLKTGPDSNGLDWWGLSGTGGGGERDRAAMGAEFVVPLTETLVLTPSIRYDKYIDETDVDDAITYGMGLEFRPVAELLLRAKYATGFRAPDMHYIYAEESGFFTTIVDYTQCYAAHAPNSPLDPEHEFADTGTETTGATCSDEDFTAGVSGSRQGALTLEEETSVSLTVGAVWSPTDNFTLSFDYYDIDLEDKVSDLDTNLIGIAEGRCNYEIFAANPTLENLVNDACTTDVLDRTPFSPNLPEVSDDLANIDIYPINTGRERQKGLDAAIAYKLETSSFGEFNLNIGYTHVIEHWQQVDKAGPLDKNYRDDLLLNGDSRSNMRGSIAWELSDWDVTLFGVRRGGTSNYNSDGRVAAWPVYNLNIGYSLTADSRIGLVANNVLDREPPKDQWAAYPYFNANQYNAFGRELFLEYRQSF